MPARLVTFTAAIVTAGAIVAAALVWGHPTARPATPAAAPIAIPDDGTWAAAAAALPLATAAAIEPAYAPDSFGESGTDPDGNGCSQRDDVLARDLADVVREGCTVVSGTLDDPYGGRTIAFSLDSAAATDESANVIRLDRVVGLRAAYDGGAWQWTPERRAEFADSVENVLAVDQALAQEKNGRGPSRWMPADDGLRCEYAIRYTWIATAWELAVSRADRDVLVATLIACEQEARPPELSSGGP